MNRYRVPASYILLVLLAAAVFTSCSTSQDRQLFKTSASLILPGVSSEILLGHVQELSSDRYMGRLTGTEEYAAAAEWVAARFKEWGLQPMGENGTFFQTFPNPYTLVFVGGELSLHLPRSKKKYTYEKDYYPGSNSGNGRVTAEVVYVGFGISALELGYDDYAGVDVEDKIVLIEPEVPVSAEEDPEIFKEWRPYSFHQYKIKMAAAHGAKGLLYNYHTTNPNIDYVKGLITAQVAPQITQDIFTGTGRTHAQVLDRIKQELKPLSFSTGKVITLENFTEHHADGIGLNVLGMLPGSDPKHQDEAIILGGHLDHVGFCYEIMPGANDNASGIAVMLGVAEALAKSRVPLRRSLLFVGFGSEEQGFKGSEAYLKKPAFPRAQTHVFINLDMVGNGDTIHALGAENYPDLWKFIDKANKKYVRRRLRASLFANLGRPRLDAAIFLSKGIPSISFSTSGAPNYAHSTLDSIDTIDPDIMADLARILVAALTDMANAKSLD